MPKYKLKDISLYFKSSCCNKSMGVPTEGFGSCQNSAQAEWHPPVSNKYIVPDGILQYFRTLSGTKNSLHATTITIGNKDIGRLSAKKQYPIFVKAIKKHIKYHSKQKYLYTFELQENGQLHAHGIEYDTYRTQFIDSFNFIGKRNSHKKAFEPVHSVDQYLKYMIKDPEFDYISNVQKKDIYDAKRSG